MKTLLLLCAFVCTTIAAPTSSKQLNALENTENLPEHKRDKKWAQDFFNSPSKTLDILPAEFLEESNVAQARSFKGPIVVKKKSGYHLYRDSDEERAAADPREKCNKHLRVKVCNEDITGKSTNKRNVSRQAYLSHDELESIKKLDFSFSLEKEREKSNERLREEIIKLANKMKSNKDHFENLEHVREALRHVEDLKDIKMEQNKVETTMITDGPKARLTQWKESVQNKDTDLKDSKGLNDVTKSHRDSDRWRLSQWKDVTQNHNIESEQKNVLDTESETVRLSQWKDASLNKKGGTQSFTDITKSNIDSDKERLSQWKEATQSKETTVKSLSDGSIGKTDEQRRAQWKDTLESNNRDSEVTKNMESNFKSIEKDSNIGKSASTIHDMSTAASEQKFEVHVPLPQELRNQMGKSAEKPTLILNDFNKPMSQTKITDLRDDSHSKSAELKREFYDNNHKYDEKLKENKNVFIFMKNAEDEAQVKDTTYENNKLMQGHKEHGFTKLVDDNKSAIDITKTSTDSNTPKIKIHGKSANQDNSDTDMHKHEHIKDVIIFMKNAENSNADDVNTVSTTAITDSDKTTQGKTADPTLDVHVKHIHTGYLPPKVPHHHHYEKEIKHIPKVTKYYGHTYVHGKSDDSDARTASNTHIDDMHSEHGDVMNKPHFGDMHSEHGDVMKKPHFGDMHSEHGDVIKKPHFGDMHSEHGDVMKKPHFGDMHSEHGDVMKKPHFGDMHSEHGDVMKKPRFGDKHSEHGDVMKKPHFGDMHSEHGDVMKKPHFGDMHSEHGDVMKKPYFGGMHSEHGHTLMHKPLPEMHVHKPYHHFEHPHDHFQMHGKSAMDIPQWKNHYYTARSYGVPSYPSYPSYNVASSGGGDAYGVFPKIQSGCSVPLLLNCSPNVTHGKLISSYSNYKPSLYRSEDDTHFQKKRETVWTNANDDIVSNTIFEQSEKLNSVN